MAEIIQFPGVNKPESKPDSETIPNLSELIGIPSLNVLYHEESIMIEGKMSVADLRRSFEESGRTEAIQGLESALAEARGKFILSTLPKGPRRTQLLVELAKNTYAVARRVQNTDLMDWASNELELALGTRRAMMVIESINIKEQLQEKS